MGIDRPENGFVVIFLPFSPSVPSSAASGLRGLWRKIQGRLFSWSRKETARIDHLTAAANTP
jgi:hypothetical protein